MFNCDCYYEEETEVGIWLLPRLSWNRKQIQGQGLLAAVVVSGDQATSHPLSSPPTHFIQITECLSAENRFQPPLDMTGKFVTYC